MNYIVSAKTDIGLTKSTNQDSLTVKVINTAQGRMVFALLCDGMGGLDKGELASAEVIRAFEQWVMKDLPALCTAPIEDSTIRAQWCHIINEQNNRIKAYGASQGIHLGTTVVAMLITPSRYYILNVGDSRAYEITDSLQQLTQDQTFVAREVALGNMTEEEARVDSRRSVLLQCVGASEDVYPDMFFGQTRSNAVYMLCSDGFRHEITSQDIQMGLNPDVLRDANSMDSQALMLIEMNKARMERDNISVILVRTY